MTPSINLPAATIEKLRAEDCVTHKADEAWTAARDRMRELFRTIKGFRYSPWAPREELYQRGQS